MKRILLILCLVVAVIINTVKAQTVLVNGVQYPQETTVVITTTYAHIDIISPPDVVSVRVEYVGSVSFWPAISSEDWIVEKRKLFRVWMTYSNGFTTPKAYRIWLSR